MTADDVSAQIVGGHRPPLRKVQSEISDFGFEVQESPISKFSPAVSHDPCLQSSAMMPGGHLATSLALGGVAYASTGSVEAAAGCFAGGFLIDVDHYLDYLLFEKQWRRPSPISFLRYYFSYSP